MNSKLSFKAILIAINIFIAESSLAQYVDLSNFKTDFYQNLPNCTLYVVLTGNKDFDNHLVQSAQNYWKICTTKTIQSSEMKNYFNNQTSIFLTPVIMGINQNGYTTRTPSFPKEKYTYDSELILYSGREKEFKDNCLSSQMICEFTVVTYFLPNIAMGTDFIVKSMNDIVTAIMEKKVTNYDAIEPFINKNAKILQQKTLLITKEIVGGLLKEKTLQDYKYKYQLTPEADIVKILESGNKGYCYLSSEFAHSKMFRIYDVETKSLIFTRNYSSGIYVNSKNIEDLNAVIGSK